MVMTLPKQEGKKIVTIGLWQCHCQNKGGKFCGSGGNAVAENGRKKEKQWLSKSGEELKKRSATSTIFLQQITCDQLLLV